MMRAPQRVPDTAFHVRTFLEPAESGSSAHVVISEATPGWYALRLSDGYSAVTLDFPQGEEGVRKYDSLILALKQLRPRLTG
jgi:hypothetical protein